MMVASADGFCPGFRVFKTSNWLSKWYIYCAILISPTICKSHGYLAASGPHHHSHAQTSVCPGNKFFYLGSIDRLFGYCAVQLRLKHVMPEIRQRSQDVVWQ